MLRKTLSRVMPSMGFVLALLFTPHCTMERRLEQDPVGETEVAENGVVLSAASWNLGFNTEGVTFDAGGGWSVTTNLGYRVHIQAGHLVTHFVALSPCLEARAEEASLFDLSISTARAHEEEMDPSAIETLAVCDLLHPQTKEIGANAFAPARYCQLYWLHARGMEGATSTDDFDMSKRTLYLEGTWERGTETGTLLIDTWWPAGAFADVKHLVEPHLFAQAAEESSVHFTWVTIDLALGRMFDDIELGIDSDAIVTDAILDNLVMGAEISMDLQSP